MNYSVLTITKDKLILQVVDPKNEGSILSEIVLGWQSGELKESLKKLINSDKDVIHNNIRILLAEDFYYLVFFEADKKLENKRLEIKKLAEELIPEKLDEVKWDYSVISKEEDNIYIQCFALPKIFNKELSIALKELGLRVDVIEPYALALSSSFKTSKSSFLLLHKDEYVSMGLVINNGLVVFSSKLETKDIDDVNELIIFSSKFHGIKPAKLLLSGIDSAFVKSLSKLLKTSEVNIVASINLAEKKLIKGKDSKVLNIGGKSGPEITLDLDPQSQDEEEIDLDDDGSKNNFNLFFVLWIIAVVGVIIGFFIVKIFV